MPIIPQLTAHIIDRHPSKAPGWLRNSGCYDAEFYAVAHRTREAWAAQFVVVAQEYAASVARLCGSVQAVSLQAAGLQATGLGTASPPAHAATGAEINELIEARVARMLRKAGRLSLRTMAQGQWPTTAAALRASVIAQFPRLMGTVLTPVYGQRSVVAPTAARVPVADGDAQARHAADKSLDELIGHLKECHAAILRDALPATRRPASQRRV